MPEPDLDSGCLSMLRVTAQHKKGLCYTNEQACFAPFCLEHPSPLFPPPVLHSEIITPHPKEAFLNIIFCDHLFTSPMLSSSKTVTQTYKHITPNLGMDML